MLENSLSVSFITLEDATDSPDLIVGFAIAPADDPMGCDNLILLRTPKYEVLLPPEERGVSVSYDGRPDKECGYLRSIIVNEGDACIRTDTASYDLDLSHVENKELHGMKTVLRLMNFDGCFQVDGV